MRKWTMRLIGLGALLLTAGCDSEVQTQVLSGLSSASTTLLDTLVQGVFQQLTLYSQADSPN